MVKAFGFGLSTLLLALSLACDGGGGGSLAIDIKDFDTARFIITQTTTTGGDAGQLVGDRVIDNRQQALSVTYEGEPSGRIIAIGRTIYTYNENEQRWASYTEPTDGQVGFGRPYWPQFWLDAAKKEELGGQTLQGVETTGYRLTFDQEKVKKRLQSPGAAEGPDVRQAEVEVWVDNSTRYAVHLTFRLELALGAQSTRIEISSSFSDFGTEAQVEAPVGATPTQGGS